MKISYNWMQEYGALHKVTPEGAPSAEQFAQDLYNAGFDVEGITKVSAEPGVRTVDDTIIDVRIPRIRRDMACMMWTAKELCGVYKIFYHDFALYGMYVPTNKFFDDISDETELHLYSTSRKCRMMCGRVVNHVDNTKVLPDWHRDRVSAQGIKLGAWYEDLQNFVNRNVGQPFYLFDLAKLGSYEICAEDASSAGTVTMGGVEYAYDPGDLVLSCNGRVISIAGVVVSDDVTPDAETDSLVMFSLFADTDEAIRIARKTGASNFNALLSTIGANPADMLKGIANCTGYLCDLFDGSGFEALEIYNKNDMTRKFLTYTVEEVNQLLDTDFSFEEIKEALDNPELNTYRIDDERITTMFPSYRTDNDVCDIAQSLLCYLGCDRIGAASQN